MAAIHNVFAETPDALILAQQLPDQSDTEVEQSIEELFELLKTAGIRPVKSIIQKRHKASRSFYLGTGKMKEIAELVEVEKIDFIVADDELNSIQVKTLEEATGIPVRDRTAIILDIFANHASTSEGKLQVELARYQYQLSHLHGGYEGLSRQGGGIGTKGPGETQLETDRRVIKDKLKKLRAELDKVIQDRQIQGRRRNDSFAPVFSLVGYTNAGKSTLLNRLTGSAVKMCDGLFTTLDPTARRVDLESGRWCILSDTVGFIRKLPHGLVRAFRATLESVVQSETLIVVCDGFDPQFRERIAAVEEVLKKIGAADKEKIIVFNKNDKGLAVDKDLILDEYPGAIFISALEGGGINTLVEKIDEILARQYRKVTLRIPSKSEVLKEVMQIAKIFSQEWGAGFVILKVEIPAKLYKRIENFIEAE